MSDGGGRLVSTAVGVAVGAVSLLDSALFEIKETSGAGLVVRIMWLSGVT